MYIYRVTSTSATTSIHVTLAIQYLLAPHIYAFTCIHTMLYIYLYTNLD